MTSILHVSANYPGLHATVGGAEHAAERIVAASGARHRNPVAVQARDADLPTGFSAVDVAERHVPRALRGITRLTLAGLFDDPWSTRSLERILARERPDVVHFHNCKWFGSAIFDLPRRHGIPSVLTVYDYWYFCPRVFLYTSGGKRCDERQGIACLRCRLPIPGGRGVATAALSLLRRRACTAHLEAIDRFHVLSESSAGVLRRQGIPGDRIAVIPQLYDPPMAPTQVASPGRPTLFWAGWLVPHKGLHVVLEAFRLLRERGAAAADAQLVLFTLPAGDTAYEERVERYVREHGLAPHVVWHRRTSRPEFLAALAGASAVLIAEQWENMSPVILTEAMAFGRPVVAGRVGGIPEFVEHGRSGLLADVDRPESYAEQLASVTSDPAAAARMGAAARADFDRLFSPAALAPRYEAMYDGLLERHAAEGRARS
jgi:glycosyltransferase involved in cell wall biosynthesis